jgi:hypothetical protein
MTSVQLTGVFLYEIDGGLSYLTWLNVIVMQRKYIWL